MVPSLNEPVESSNKGYHVIGVRWGGMVFDMFIQLPSVITVINLHKQQQATDYNFIFFICPAYLHPSPLIMYLTLIVVVSASLSCYLTIPVGSF